MEPPRRPQRDPRRPSALRYSTNAADISPLRTHSEVPPQQSLRVRVLDAGRRCREQIRRTVKNQGLSLRQKNMGSPVSSGSSGWTIAEDHKPTPTLANDSQPNSEQISPRITSLNSPVELLRGKTLVQIPEPSGFASLTTDNAQVPSAMMGSVLPSDAEPPIKKTQGRYSLFEWAKDGVIRTRATKLAEETTVPPDGDLLGVGSHFSEQDGGGKLASSHPQPDAANTDTADTPQNMAQNINAKAQDAVTGNHDLSSRNTTSHHRYSSAIIHQDHSTNDPKIKLLSLRTPTGSTTQTSVHPSIFDGRRNSSCSISTCGEPPSRASFPPHNISLMQECPSSSSLATSNNAPRQDLDLEDNTVPGAPDGHMPALPTIDNLVNRQEDSISDQGTTSAWVTQQRLSTNYQDQVSSEGIKDKGEHKKVTSGLNLTLGAQNYENTNVKPALSVIDEQGSDAGCSTNDVVLSKDRTADDSPGQEHLSIPQSLSAQRAQRPRSLSEAETTEGQSYTCSEDLRPHNHTPATSATDRPSLDIPEIAETSEEDESMSNFTDETDETAEGDDSFLEAFEATSLSSDLLPCIIALRDQVAGQVFEKVSQWIRSCNSGKGTEGADSNLSAPSESNSGFNNFNNSPGYNGGGKKRGPDGGDLNRSGNGDGDDHGKRQKTDLNSATQGAGQSEKKLACPFWKKYPDGKLSPSCSKQGWVKVHRIKEHIYKYHMIPIHCQRCITVFKTKAELTEHCRQALPCTVDTAQNIIGIDEAVKGQLKSRRGIKGLPEIDLWTRMYKIIFPDDVKIPEPYYNPEIMKNPQRVEDIVSECSDFIRQTVPQIINQTTENIFKMPETRGQQRVLYEIIQKAVWEGIENAIQKLEQRLLSKITSYQAGMSEGPTEETAGNETPAVATPIAQHIQNHGSPSEHDQFSLLQHFLDNNLGDGGVPVVDGSLIEYDLLNTYDPPTG